MKRILLMGCMVLSAFAASSKEPELVEEQTLIKMLRSEKFAIDLKAHAVVINEKGNVIFTYSDRRTYNQTTVERMVRILDEEGTDVNDVTIYLQENQHISSVKTFTYSLSNGRKLVTKTPDKAYKETVTDSGRTVKLNFKDAKPGTIIYYTYTVKTAQSYNIPVWYFEGKYPVLHSEFMVTSDYGTEFAVISNKNIPFPEVAKEEDISFCENCRYSVNQHNTTVMARSSIWAKNNIPAVKGEVNAKMDNIRVQLARIRVEKQLPTSNNAYNLNRNDEYLQDVELSNWEQVNAKLLYGHEYLGKMVYAVNGYLKDVLENVLRNKTTDMDRAQAIYDYVKNGIRLKGGSSSIYAGNSLKKILQLKEGTIAEKNILLVALMRRAGLDCEPMVLVTDTYEPLRTDFPVYSVLNYVAGRLRIDNKEYLLDASDPALVFGKLKPECYNGLGYAVNKTGTFVTLNP